MSSQGASNGPSQAAGSQFVKFSRASAQRIAKAVRTVEVGDRSQPGVAWDHPIPTNAKIFKIARYTGSWSKDSSKTVTVGVSPNTSTLTAQNVLMDIGDNGSQRCAIAKDGTAWYLITPEHTYVDSVVGVSLSSDALTFSRMRVWVPMPFTAASVAIGVTACPS